MSPEILTILGMTATLLIATWTMNRSLRTELREDIIEVREEIKEVRGEIKEVRGEIKEVRGEIDALREAQHGLDNRMARLEGLMQGLKEAIVARSVA